MAASINFFLTLIYTRSLEAKLQIMGIIKTQVMEHAKLIT